MMDTLTAFLVMGRKSGSENVGPPVGGASAPPPAASPSPRSCSAPPLQTWASSFSTPHGGPRCQQFTLSNLRKLCITSGFLEVCKQKHQPTTTVDLASCQVLG